MITLPNFAIFRYIHHVRMSSKRVYVMYEIEQREFRSRLMLAKLLSHNGFEVLIFQHRMLSMLALFAKPGTVFLKSNPYQFDYSISLLSKRGFKIYLWQEEGIHFRRDQKESPVFSTKSVPWIYKYLAWHPTDASFAIKQGFPSERVEICGNTRMELASKIDRRRGNSNDPLRLLVVSNFDMSAMSYNFLTDGSMGATAARESQDEFDLIKSVALKNFQLYEELLNRVDFSRFKVTYRPYFFEQQISTFSTNVSLDQNLSVIDTLKSSDVVVHYGSTVGVEAVQAGILSINLSADLTSIDPRILGVSLNFSEVTELLARLYFFSENPTELESVITAQAAACIKWYEIDFRRSGQSQLILKELLEGTFVPGKDFPNFSTLRVLYLELRNFLGGMKRASFRRVAKRKAPLLSAERIQREHSMFAVDSRFMKVKYFGRALKISP